MRKSLSKKKFIVETRDQRTPLSEFSLVFFDRPDWTEQLKEFRETLMGILEKISIFDLELFRDGKSLSELFLFFSVSFLFW